MTTEQWHPASQYPEAGKPIWVEFKNGDILPYPSRPPVPWSTVVRWCYATQPALPVEGFKKGELVLVSHRGRKDSQLDIFERISGEFYKCASGDVYDYCRRPTADELRSMGLMRIPSDSDLKKAAKHAAENGLGFLAGFKHSITERGE